MCLIIQRDPKVKLPFEKFKTAVLNNPDGWGMSYPDEDGKLITLRNPEKPNVDKLFRLIDEELFDKQLLVHLRYTTAGETVLRNAHPFPILERGADGIDLRMAHNGTISKWVEHRSDESDTRRFVRGFVRPLFKRLIRGNDLEDLLTDPFVVGILEDQLPKASVLSFIDGVGNTLNVNATGNGGKQEEGVYYSNTYSFNPKHREPTSYNNSRGDSGWYSYPSYGSPKPKQEPKQDLRHADHAKDTDATRLTEVFELPDIEALYDLDDDSIKTLISKCPDETFMLIAELLEAHQKQGEELNENFYTLSSLREEIKELKEKVKEKK